MLRKLFRRKEKVQAIEVKDVPSCDHEWFHAGTSTEEIYNGREPRYYDVVNMFCPKCKQEDTASKEDWARIEKQQEITKEYQESLAEKA